MVEIVIEEYKFPCYTVYGSFEMPEIRSVQLSDCLQCGDVLSTISRFEYRLKGSFLLVNDNNNALLEYQDQIWQGGDGSLFVRMDTITFHRYVQQYLAIHCGSDEPTGEQRSTAIAHCRALSYWRDCVDPEVSIGYKGEAQTMTLPPTNQSEIATLLSQIDAEHSSAQEALHGLASGSSRHAFISARIERIHIMSQRLIDTLGKEEALPLIVAALDRLNS